MILNRRRFLTNASLVAAGSLACPGDLRSSWANPVVQKYGREPAAEPGHFRLGLAAYSFREHFGFFKGKPQKPRDGKEITMFDFIDYCSEQGCGAELTSYFFPADANQEYYLKLKQHAFVRGVPIVGTAIGNNFTVQNRKQLEREIADAKRWIDRASHMGAPHIRFFAGTRKQLEATPETLGSAIQALQECVEYAEKKGIFIGVENHGQLTADQVLAICNGVKSDWFGVNLDSGNFISDDPYRDIERCAERAVNVQIKIKIKTSGNEVSETDLGRVAKILTDANYRGFVVLEFEESDPFKHVPVWMEKLRAAF
ncbi:MAG: sugar phosphate isomerase/epimerase [Mariniblastus sp.]|jgi:sugar phosphate isomerase/epimerase